MKEKTFIIIDGNAIIHRVYHALPPLTTKDGTIVNAVYGFTSMLLKVLTEMKPDYLAVSFDVAGGTFRDKLYTEYKATRVKADQALYDQIPLVYSVVQAFGIPIYTQEGFEADDVIATLVTKMHTEDDKLKAIIVTGDMDMLQLVNDDVVEVYLLRKGMSDFELYNEAKVKERFGFWPEHIVDYKALRGDTSDNIPGVKGIGDKTAKELIEKIGGVEEIYEVLSSQFSVVNSKFSPSVIKKLKEGEKDAMMSKELASLRHDVPGVNVRLEETSVAQLDFARARTIIQKFEFFSLLKRVPGGNGDTSSETPKSKEIKAKQSTGVSKRKTSLTLVDEKTKSEFLTHFSVEPFFVSQAVLAGTDVLTSELQGIVFLVGQQPYFVKNAGESFSTIIKTCFSDPKKILVGHDVKQLVKALLCQGIEVGTQLFDVMIASYVINSSTRAHDLKSIVLRELGDGDGRDEAMPRLYSSARQDNLFGADPNVVAQELSTIPAIYERYRTELARLEQTELFQTIEMALIPVLAHVELAGVAIDTGMLHKLSDEFAKEVKRLTTEIWKEAGEEFNISSSVQLRDILFEKMKLPRDGVKKGKTGFSTAASELDKLRDLHPIIPLIEEYRELTKLQNTYVDVLPTLINKKTGRIHTSFNQAVASTGRLSSSDPNLQNIPIRTDLGRKIRDAFVAPPGGVLIAADYSQIELRIAASLANDKKMIAIFERGEDIHLATAAAMNGVSLSKVTKQMRNAAKGINFGILYGMGSYGLSWRANIPQWQAKEFIAKYFEQFSQLKTWLDETLAFAKKEGYAETLFGRRRYIPELQASNFQLRSAGERMAINMPIQGTAADMMKMAMIEINKKLEIRNPDVKYGVPYPPHVEHRDWKLGIARMILQVHDELVFEVKKGLENEVAEMVKNEMEDVVNLRVPVVVDVHAGTRWGEMK